MSSSRKRVPAGRGGGGLPRAAAVLLGLAVFAAAAGGCSIVDNGAFIRLQEDVEGMKKEVAAVRSSAPPPSAAVPPAARGADAAELASFQKTLADLQADQDRVKSDLLAAASRAEDAKLQTQKEISRLNAKTDEQAQALLEVRAKAARIDDVDRRLNALEEKVERLASSVRAAAPPPAPVPAPSTEQWKSPEEMYDNALGLIKNGENRKGRDILVAFAAKYPDHRLLPNVYYWKGETFYAEKDYENAIIAFQDVVDKYPAGEKAPDAMLKQGLSFQSLKDNKNARLIFQLVQSKYPKSPAAEKARKKLAELK